MDDLVKRARQSRHSHSVAYKHFQSLFARNAQAHVSFVEGRDQPYYFSIIRSSRKSSTFLPTGGKENVLKIHDLISRDAIFTDAKVAFFVDKDFDNPVQNTKIYETPYHSIENFYVNSFAFENILQNCLHVQVTDPNYETCLALFHDRFTEFTEIMTFPNAWLMGQILIFASGESQLQLNNFNLDNYLKIQLKKVVVRNQSVLFPSFFPQTKMLSDADLAPYLSFLSQKPVEERHKFFRGKWNLDFFVKFITLLIQALNNGDQSLNIDKHRTVFQCQRNTALSILSSYADIPECLYEYIDNYF